MLEISRNQNRGSSPSTHFLPKIMKWAGELIGKNGHRQKIDFYGIYDL